MPGLENLLIGRVGTLIPIVNNEKQVLCPCDLAFEEIGVRCEMESFALEIIQLRAELLHGNIACKFLVSEEGMITEYEHLLICCICWIPSSSKAKHDHKH